ncbi:hypothetical protein [Streptomyces sp. NBC_00338]|uniref:hypothetical protein n=1 Tax=Streptomyces sp. NBC_00338 TaxID=2975715 RepID=UPI0022535A0C|nr:hypothetical protein [Streptomyces sp. NBC_00338]MCX5143660.1 hypothetical protein [Streptomyces sp. NBC_00338]
MLAPLVLVACSGGGGSPDGAGESASASGSARAEPGPGPGPEDTGDIDADPAKLPASRKEALDLIGRVIAEPAAFGPGVVKRSPYESDPATWPVLGTDCVWQQKKPAAGVLATRSRSFEVPAADGKGPMRLSAVVTVHRTRDDARWEMAESVEETMRCPTQQLRQGELIGSMIASSLGQGEAGQVSADDTLLESGQYRNAELGGGPYPYSWYQSQSLQFTVAVTGKGAKGWSQQEIDVLTDRAHSAMLLRIKAAVEKKS